MTEAFPVCMCQSYGMNEAVTVHLDQLYLTPLTFQSLIVIIERLATATLSVFGGIVALAVACTFKFSS